MLPWGKTKKIVRVRCNQITDRWGATVSPTIARNPVGTLFFIDFYIRQFGILRATETCKLFVSIASRN